MKKILVVAEHDNKIFKSLNQHTLAAAETLAKKFDTAVEIDILLAGEFPEALLFSACQFDVAQVLCANHAVYGHQLPENMALLIADIGKTYDYILMAATTTGKNILPRVAGFMQKAMLADVTEILSPDTFVRPLYAGNALATCQLDEACRLLTIRPTAFQPVLPSEKNSSQAEKIVKLNIIKENFLSSFVSETQIQSARPALSDARIVIAGGRGLKNAENFRWLEKIADALGAAIGASRAAVDAGFAPNDWQIGQTGKIVAPDLYIAVGISGAIQHLAGMKDSKIVVAINIDAEAPINTMADYILTGDLFQILPELEAALAAASK